MPVRTGAQQRVPPRSQQQGGAQGEQGYVDDAVCSVYTCRRLIDLSNDCRYTVDPSSPGAEVWTLNDPQGSAVGSAVGAAQAAQGAGGAYSQRPDVAGYPQGGAFQPLPQSVQQGGWEAAAWWQQQQQQVLPQQQAQQQHIQQQQLAQQQQQQQQQQLAQQQAQLVLDAAKRRADQVRLLTDLSCSSIVLRLLCHRD